MSQEKSLMFCSHTCQNLMEHIGINQNLGWDEAYGWFIPINWFVRTKLITLMWIRLLGLDYTTECPIHLSWLWHKNFHYPFHNLLKL